MSEKNERVVIIGGSSGIGLATAQKLLGPNMRVTITGRNQERLNSAWQSLGGAVDKAAFYATKPDEFANSSIVPVPSIILSWPPAAARELVRSKRSTLPTSAAVSTRKSGRNSHACRRPCRP